MDEDIRAAGRKKKAHEGQGSPFLIALHLLRKLIRCDHNMVLGGLSASQQLGFDVLQPTPALQHARYDAVPSEACSKLHCAEQKASRVAQGSASLLKAYAVPETNFVFLLTIMFCNSIEFVL